MKLNFGEVFWVNETLHFLRFKTFKPNKDNILTHQNEVDVNFKWRSEKINYFITEAQKFSRVPW